MPRATYRSLIEFSLLAMIKTTGVVHFTIPVSCTRRSEKFYRDILGLEMVRRVPSAGMVFMRTGNDYLILTESKTPIDPNPGNEIHVHHAFQIDVDDYERSLAFLKRNGIEVLYEENRRSGVFVGRQAYFHDPDRNVLEISALERAAGPDTD